MQQDLKAPCTTAAASTVSVLPARSQGSSRRAAAWPLAPSRRDAGSARTPQPLIAHEQAHTYSSRHCRCRGWPACPLGAGSRGRRRPSKRAASPYAGDDSLQRLATCHFTTPRNMGRNAQRGAGLIQRAAQARQRIQLGSQLTRVASTSWQAKAALAGLMQGLPLARRLAGRPGGGAGGAVPSNSLQALSLRGRARGRA